MWVSRITEDNLTDDVIDRLLFDGLEDNGERADCIIVLGSIKATEYRVPVAAEVYEAGRSGKILLCGGKVRKFVDGSMTEAAKMRQKLLELGVPETDILIEENSQNTIENILCALLELQRSMWLNRIKSVLLVTTSYHMCRSLHIARYLFPAHIKVYPCPADDTTTTRSNWMNGSDGRKRAKTEALKIVNCVNNGVVPDFEI